MNPDRLSCLFVGTFAILLFGAFSSIAQVSACTQRNPLEEKTDFEARIKADPNDYWGYVLRGWDLYKRNRPEVGIKEINHALELKPGDSSALEARGRIYYSMARFDQAINDLTNAILANPQNYYALFHRAQIYMHNDSYMMAKDDLEHALEARPDLVEAYDDLGRVLRRMGDEAAARTITTNILEHLNNRIDDPKLAKCKPQLMHARGLARLEAGNPRSAIEDLTVAIDLRPSESIFYYHRGVAYYSERSLDKAIADFTKSIELNSYWADSYRFRAIAYRDSGQPNLAEADEKRYRDIGGAIDLRVQKP